MKTMTEKDEKRELEFVMYCLAVVCACGVLALALRVGLLVVDWSRGAGDGAAVLVDGINLVVAAVCGVLVFVIMREVKRRHVFTRKNANLVSVIGCVAVLGGIAQNAVVNFLFEDRMVNNGDMTFLILGVFLLFLSCLFKIGIRMKEEQELTV